MAFVKPKINTVTTDIGKIRIYIRAIKKWGKTTLFRDYIEELYKGDADKGLLVGIGHEHGYDLLDNLNVTHVNTWNDLLELKKWLIEEKGKEHNIEVVGFDVVDEMIPLAEKRVCQLSTIQTQKKCTTLNQAFGGYGKGQDKVCEIIKEFFSELRDAGFGFWAIAHTKDKVIKEKGMTEDESYQMLTSNLTNKYEAIFGDIFDAVMTGYIDKDVVDGRIQSSVRKLALRGDCYVEAGCRFGNGSIPEYIECCDNSKDTAKLLIETLKNGLKDSRSTKITDKEFEKLEKEEMEERRNRKITVSENESNEKIEEIELNEETESNEDKRNEILKTIRSYAKNREAIKLIQEVVNEYGCKKIDELSIDGLIKIDNKLKNEIN